MHPIYIVIEILMWKQLEYEEKGISIISPYLHTIIKMSKNKFDRTNLSMRKSARGPRSPDIDPYSKETRETSKERPMQMSMYLKLGQI